MKDLIIVCAGGFGREAYYLARGINRLTPRWHIRGFIDDNLDALGDVKCDVGVIGTIKDWQPSDNEEFVMGVASPRTKEFLSHLLKARGAKFVTLVSPGTTVCDYTTIGEGCLITGFVGDNVKIGNFVNIAGSMIGQDSIIGDFSTTTGYTNIVSAVLGERVFIGSHAVVLHGRRIGDDAFVCAGSVVFNHVKAGQKVLGNPAKKIDL